MAYLTPYDTGRRCEPRPWPTATRQRLENASPDALGLEEDRFGKVDFEDDEGGAVCVVHVERSRNGTCSVHIEALCEDDSIRVELTTASGSSCLEPNSARWRDAVTRELAGALEDRENADSFHAAEWLAAHEGDDRVRDLVGGILDRIMEIAAEDDGVVA